MHVNFSSNLIKSVHSQVEFYLPFLSTISEFKRDIFENHELKYYDRSGTSMSFTRP